MENVQAQPFKFPDRLPEKILLLCERVIKDADLMPYGYFNYPEAWTSSPDVLKKKKISMA